MAERVEDRGGERVGEPVGGRAGEPVGESTGERVTEPVAERVVEPATGQVGERRAGRATAFRRYEQHAPGVLPAVQSLLYVLIVSLFLMTFTVQPIRIPSPSMEPTLLVGDFLLLDRQSVSGAANGLLPPVRIAHGDVVVFHDPVDDPSVHLVKRVIGVPGDRIHLRDGVVYRNGEKVTEPYAVYRQPGRDNFRDNFPSLQTMDPGVNPEWWVRLRGLVHDGEVTVPPGNYFVMGDNRDDSEDSRYWGFVPRQAIVGKPVMIYFSWRQPGEDAVNSGGVPDVQQGRLSFGRWERTFRVVR